MSANAVCETPDVTAAGVESGANAAAPVEPNRPDWILALTTPLADGDEREDPRYGDAFVVIKQEIDKLSGNDYDLIVNEAKSLLTEEGKDLRVAGYLLLALSYVHGIDGFRDGLWIYQGLLENCADQLFPRKPSARLAALRWLNNPKLAAYVEEHAERAGYDTLEQIRESIEAINSAVFRLMEGASDEIPRFTLLDDWLEEQIEKQRPAPAAEPTPAPATEEAAKDEPVAVISTPEPSLPDPAGAELTEAERLKIGQTLCRHFIEAGDWMRAVALARALRWSGLKLPPNEKGRTRLPAPRMAGTNAIRNALADNNAEEALRLSEAMLFEPSCQFLLDLAWLSHEAAKAMGNAELARQIARQTGLLLERLQGVLDLQFEDGTPFASAESRSWLEQCIPGSEGGGAGLQARLDEELNNLIDQAREVANAQGLPEALNLFAGYGAYTERQRFLMRMAMAGLCLEHGKVDIAWPVIDELWRMAEERHLAWWDTDLVVTLARYARNALRALMGQADDARREHYAQRLEAIHEAVCRIDMQQALSMT